MKVLDWFEWNGVRCTEYGMYVLDLPERTRPTERGSSVTIPGRSGVLNMWEGDDVFDTLSLGCTCLIREPYNEEVGDRLAGISGWLRGLGTIRFANRPDGFYRGRVSNQLTYSKIVRGKPQLSLAITFDCEPFFYLDSGLTPITLDMAGDVDIDTASITLKNPGNVSSEPLLKVTGTGEGTIMAGENTMLVDRLNEVDYLMLDCEQKVAYKGERNNPEDPLTLLGTMVTGEWLKLPAGDSFFTIEGDISKVEITPRWRCI